MKYKVIALVAVVCGILFLSNGIFGSEETIATYNNQEATTPEPEETEEPEETKAIPVSIDLSSNGAASDHYYVDLGLPSGTKWATCNVGAVKPTETGNYFAWGETKPKEVYGWKTYKWCTVNKDEENYDIFKYAKSINNYTPNDQKKVLEAKDDAATANWGNSWRTPTNEEFEELLTGCNWEWVANINGTGVAGEVGTSIANGATIFFPATGIYNDDHIGGDGTFGNYWASTLHENMSYTAYFFTFNDNNLLNILFNERYHGRNVRAVLK